MEGIGQFNPATVQFETFGNARIIAADPRERRFARGIGVKDGGSPEAELRFDPLAQKATEDVRPVIVRRDAQTGLLRLASELSHVRRAANWQTVVQVHANVAPKRISHREKLRRLERTGLPTTKDRKS